MYYEIEFPFLIFRKKSMITLFVRINGTVLFKANSQKQKINSEYIINEILFPFKQEIEAADASRKRKTFNIYYDKDQAHSSQYTKNYLDHSSFTLLPHPTYSPNLLPCDFNLFCMVKEVLKESHSAQRKSFFMQMTNFFRKIKRKMENHTLKLD